MTALEIKNKLDNYLGMKSDVHDTDKRHKRLCYHSPKDVNLFGIILIRENYSLDDWRVSTIDCDLYHNLNILSPSVLSDLPVADFVDSHFLGMVRK